MKPILVFAFSLLLLDALAQDGTKDNTFGSSGVAQVTLVAPNGATPNTVSDLTKIAVQADGKIVQVGYKSSSTGDDFIVIRYNSNGTPDMSFGTSGGFLATDISGGNDRAHYVAIQPDGMIVVAGEAVVGGKNIGVIVRYNSSGVPDAGFGTNGIVRSDFFPGASGINAVGIQSDGKIVVAGFASNGANNDFFVARYLANGTLDASFGISGKTVIDFASGTDVASDINILPDGRILLAGWARSGATDAFALARLTSAGSLDASFNTTGKLRTTIMGQGRSIAVNPAGTIYFTGLSGAQFTTASFNPDGSVNTGFGGGVVQTNFGGTANSRSVVVQSDGKILVGGDYSSSYAVARYMPNGTPDLSFNSTGRAFYNTGNNNRDFAYSGLALQNGKILIGGISFTAASFYFRFHPTVMRLNNSLCTPSGNITPAMSEICEGQSQLLTANGGTSYQWSRDGTPISGATSATYNATIGGQYSVIIFNGTCSAPASNTATVSVSPNPVGTITPGSASICPGGSATLMVSGGKSYQWKKDGVDIPGATAGSYNVTSPGTYSVTIFDVNCSAPSTNSVVVTQTPAPTGTISPSSASICPGGFQRLTVTGGTSYQWKKDGVNIPGATSDAYNATSAGTYTAAIFNGSCSGTSSNSSVITTGSSPSGSISPANGSICPGGTVTLTVTGGTSYQWKKDGVDISGATAATYNATDAGTYTATIFNGSCSGPASNSSVITASSAPSGSISPASGSICPGGSVKLTVTGGTSYQWKKDGVDIAGATADTLIVTTAGTYTATIFNGSCSGPASNSSVITVGSSPSGSISPASGSICPGGSVTLTVTGGTSYQWKRDGVDISGATSSTYSATQAGTYTATIFNGSCSGPASNSSVITASSAPSGSISPASGSICPGGSLMLTVTGGTSYQWKKDGVDISGATSATYNATDAGTYTATIFNGSCSGPASNSSVITVSSSPTGSISPASGSICPGGSVTLTVTGGTSYQWKKDGVDISGATAATYNATDAGTYTATIFNGSCSGPASNSSVITASSAPSGSISPASGSICPGGSVTLTVTGGTSYQWKKDGVDISGATSSTYNATDAGTYTATIFNGSCSGPTSNSSVITASSAPSGSISPASGSICPGGTVTLTVTGGTSYQWKKDGVDISGATAATYNATDAGTYTATIFNGSCSGPASNSSVITAGSSPSGSISPASGSICPGGSVTLTVTGGTSYQWKRDGVDISGATSSTYSATQAGTYTATVFNGSCSGPASNSSIITASSAPTGSISPASGSICPGGSLTLTVTGGTSYQWKKDGVDISGATSATYNATDAGTYTATIFNGSCSGPASNSSVITVSSSPTGSISPASGSICPGGSVKLTVTGGTSYQWKKDGVDIAGATADTLIATTAGTYTATIFNGSCSGPASNTSVITAGSAPSGSISPASGSICPGGSVKLTVTGGTSYQWKKDGVDIVGATADTLIATTAGTYTATIFNGSCSGPASNSSVITVSSSPNGSISPASGSICPGGSLMLTVTGGTSYQWKRDGVDIAGATADTLIVTTAGTYTATIFNGSCSGPASNSSVITAGSSPSGSISPASGSICPGGSVKLTVTGGTSYQWKKDGVDIAGATADTLIATTAGTYTATIFNGSCSGPASNSSVITVSSSPNGSISPASGSICPGGSLMLTVTGGTSYQWKKDGVDITGATSSTFNATDAGTYTATIFNGSCSGPASNSSVITAGSSPSGSISPASGSICPGGSVKLTVTGGTSYQWKKDGVDIAGATADTLIATTAGTYTATIFNGSCSGPASNNSVITISSSPTGSISPASGSICPGGSLMLTVTGGTSYQWKKDGVDISGATSAAYNATDAGTYTATIFNGSCSGPASNSSVITVSSSPTGSISPASGSICPGGSLTLTVTGGTSYQWKKDGVDISGATSATYNATDAGTYTATIFNGSCSGPASNSSVITVSSSPTGSISPASGSICPGGSLMLTVTGGTSYQWKKDGIDISGATSATYSATDAGTYTATIFNGSCSGAASNNSVITISSSPTGSISPASGSICPGGSLTLTVTGGTSYQWKKDGVDIAGATADTLIATTAGTYTATIFNGSCSGPASNSSVITAGSSPSGSISPASGSICPGGSLTLTVTGGTSYQWRKDGVDIAGATADTLIATTAGTYTATIFNGSCSGPAANSSVITVSSSPTGSISPASGSICPGGSLTLTVTGGTSYQWKKDGVDIPGATSSTLSVTQPGTYTATIFNGSCTGASSNSAVITLGSSPSGNITPASANICSGSIATLAATGGTSYQWLRNGIPIPGETKPTYDATIAGTYKAIVYNGNCQGITADSSVVTVTPSPGGTITPASATICDGGSQVLRVSGGTSYQWQLNGTSIAGAVSDSFTATQAGTYTVIIYYNSCAGAASNSSVITMNKPVSTISPATSALCPGQSVTLAATGGDTYQWIRNGTDIGGATGSSYTTTIAGTYRVRITKNGCSALSENSAVVTSVPLPVGRISPAADSVCVGESKTFRVTGGVSYQWFLNGNAISGANADTFTATQPGVYTVQISNGTCSAMASNSGVLKPRQRPSGTISTFHVKKNTPYSLQVREGLSYTWTPAADLSDPASRSPIVTASQDRTYLVTITQRAGCPVTDTVIVRVFDEPEIYVPNAFTPNNDGKNDVLRPVPVNIKEITYFQVYNRNGEMVFQTRKLGEGWDGVFKGKPQPNGVFVWIFSGIDSDGKKVTAKGTSLLIR